ncbi:retinol-binding protein pinta [Leptinotarsa decemlineata]|uniref:retinol-binding protein pinta n=1 Tax=Leptinotarsa decemlineata TaxID=7539 RepID=UPI000C252656|nr:alpha-tocopherol transfer protein-like [Leptinotarsa decemlineata]
MEEKKQYFENISRVLERGLKVNNKTEEDLKENIMIVKKWVETQPHLPEMPDDHMITSFLIMNKFSVENVKQKIDMYYTMRSLYPDYFENKHPLSPCMQDTMDKMCFIPMPKATDEEYRVIIFCIFEENADLNIINFYSLLYNVIEVRMKEDYNVGDIMVYDCKNLNLGHLAQCTPTQIKNYSTILEKAFNNNIKQIHLLNYPSFAEPVINLARRLLNPKIAQRFFFHKSTDTIQDYVSKDILPKDYGGTGLTLREYNEIWRQKFTDYKERFDILNTLRVNEELRPSPLINDEVLGYYGHFKKVAID